MKTNKKEFTVYETPSIDELELINEGAIFTVSEDDDDDDGVGGEGNLGGETGWGY